MHKEKKRVVSGMRPTGKLHLGHLHGVLENWLILQREYDCFFFIADWHALTSNYANPASIREGSREMLIDWLAAGVNPDVSTIFVQSKIKEHAEMHLLLSMITPLSWLERNPTYKEQLAEIKGRDIRTYGFLGYPVLQTADIIIYKADNVPVGVDQAPHVELSREIVRKFNNLYGRVFPEPKTMLANVPKLFGTDGRKMSKSYGNAVFLSDPPDLIERKLLTMVTDPARMRRTDPGNPDICPLFLSYHTIYSSSETVEWVKCGCKSADIGCIDCKKKVIPEIMAHIEPIAKKRNELERDKGYIDQILISGEERARYVAKETIDEVRKVFRLT